MKDLFIILLTSSLINNIVLSQFLGLCPLMSTSEKTKTAARMGMTVIFVITFASAINGFIYEYILLKRNVVFLKTIIFILVIIALVQLIELIMKRFFNKSFKAMGMYLPVIMTNCVVLGAMLINAQTGFGFLHNLMNGFALAFGFAIVIIIMAGIREKIIYNNIPESFKGLPVILLIAGLMSMAFFGFTFLI
ncbi:MAG: electron transport complex subunit RsxA [Lachnospiraceae bacterium]|nr:electron transport complex subunit RsxA [Lachnospiraceae bacterium]